MIKNILEMEIATRRTEEGRLELVLPLEFADRIVVRFADMNELKTINNEEETKEESSIDDKMKKVIKKHNIDITKVSPIELILNPKYSEVSRELGEIIENNKEDALGFVKNFMDNDGDVCDCENCDVDDCPEHPDYVEECECDCFECDEYECENHPNYDHKEECDCENCDELSCSQNPTRAQYVNLRDKLVNLADKKSNNISVRMDDILNIFDQYSELIENDEGLKHHVDAIRNLKKLKDMMNDRESSKEERDERRLPIKVINGKRTTGVVDRIR